LTAYRKRFVGSTELPKNLSPLDVEQVFLLSQEETEAIKAAFRSTNRLGGAIQLLFLRATGRTSEKVAGLPISLLKATCLSLGISHTSIASLKTLYKRRSTLYEHQAWAKERLGYREPDEHVFKRLTGVLAEHASAAVSLDELVVQGVHWLFENRWLNPGDRPIRDVARAAFAATDAKCIAAMHQDVPPAARVKVIAAIYGVRRGRGGSVLEWLKRPPKRHGPSTLGEVTEKISFLKGLGVDKWALDGIASARLHAYGQSVARRAPSATKRILGDQHDLEIVCFLRMTLMELTDVALYMAGRRVNDLVRHATTRVEAKQARGVSHYRERQEQIRSIVHDDETPTEQRIQSLKELLPKNEREAQYTRAALVRQSLVDDGKRVAAVLNSFVGLEVQGPASDPAMKQIAALKDLHARKLTELPTDFDIKLVDSTWRELLLEPDRARALAAFRAATLTSVRRAFRAGRLWIDHSSEYRNRESLLIPREQWKKERSQLVSALSLTIDSNRYLERLRANLTVGLAALSEAVKAGKLEIDDRGIVRLPALHAADQESSVTSTRDAMFNLIGDSQFSDMIVQMDVDVGFSEILLGRKATSIQELLATYGALLAHGTENDAKGVAAMIPGVEVAHISGAMRAMEEHGRLRKANTRVVEFQRQHPIAALWGNGEKASADMMALDASKHLFNARIDPRRRTYAIGLYTHVQNSYGIIYDQPIVLNERQAAVAVDGVEKYNTGLNEDGLRLSLLAVDTHGYTNVAMTVAKLLGFDLCPQLRNLSERKLFLPKGMDVPENLSNIALENVSERAIVKGWDELLRLIASIRTGRVSAKTVLERLGSAAQGELMHQAADSLGRLLRSLFLCDFWSNQDFRREIHTLLNRGESVHQLQRAVFHGRVMPDRARRRDEVFAISGAHTLLSNIVIAWNTKKMQEVVDRWRAEKHPIEDVWIRRMGPVHFGNVNFGGTMSFGIEKFADALLQKSAARRRA
jgi:TnpA family transposase